MTALKRPRHSKQSPIFDLSYIMCIVHAKQVFSVFYNFLNRCSSRSIQSEQCVFIKKPKYIRCVIWTVGRTLARWATIYSYPRRAKQDFNTSWYTASTYSFRKKSILKSLIFIDNYIVLILFLNWLVDLVCQHLLNILEIVEVAAVVLRALLVLLRLLLRRWPKSINIAALIPKNKMSVKLAVLFLAGFCLCKNLHDSIPHFYGIYVVSAVEKRYDDIIGATAVLPEAKIKNPEMVPFFQELELVIPKLKEINEQILELSRYLTNENLRCNRFHSYGICIMAYSFSG